MYARKNGGRFHVNPDPQVVDKLVNEGYEILDDNLRTIENPVEEAEKEFTSSAVTGTIEDFFKYCADHNIAFL